MGQLQTGSGWIGIDEAGRGPLAGPVVAAAVVLPDGFDLSGIGDSKQLSPGERETAYSRIVEHCAFACVRAEPGEIDELNILWATMAAMERAYFDLGKLEGPVFIDGNRVPRRLVGRAEAVVKGDGKIACIAAASIVAKVVRDRIMCDYAAEFPVYGFERHFGYPTPDHLQAIEEHGACSIHRRSFRPFKTEEQLCLTLEH